MLLLVILKSDALLLVFVSIIDVKFNFVSLLPMTDSFTFTFTFAFTAPHELLQLQDALCS